MKIEYTPGPWHVTGYHVEARAGAIATVCDAGDGDTEGDANARLIAAAPELLAALQELVAEWDARHADEDHRTGYTLDTWGVQLARAAIATAIGDGRA